MLFNILEKLLRTWNSESTYPGFLVMKLDPDTGLREVEFGYAGSPHGTASGSGKNIESALKILAHNLGDEKVVLTSREQNPKAGDKTASSPLDSAILGGKVVEVKCNAKKDFTVKINFKEKIQASTRIMKRAEETGLPVTWSAYGCNYVFVGTSWQGKVDVLSKPKSLVGVDVLKLDLRQSASGSSIALAINRALKSWTYIPKD